MTKCNVLPAVNSFLKNKDVITVRFKTLNSWYIFYWEVNRAKQVCKAQGS